MSVEKAKQLILKSFTRNSKEGTHYDDQFVFLQSMGNDVVHNDVLEAERQLYAEGFLDSKGCLTGLGFTLLFPSNLPAIRQQVLNEFKNQRLRANDIVDMRLLNINLLMHLNTQEREDVFKILEQLHYEGILDIEKQRIRLIKPI